MPTIIYIFVYQIPLFFTWCVSVSILRRLLVFFYLLCNEFLKCLFAFDFMEVFAKKKNLLGLVYMFITLIYAIY